MIFARSEFLTPGKEMRSRWSPALRAFFESVLLRTWTGRGWLASLLWPLSRLFALIISCRLSMIRRGLTSQTRLDVPVIVIGNIFVGGTGKTPLVIWLAQNLVQAGWLPGVISRGYGAHAQTITEVQDDSLATVVGDEPLLIAQRAACPVVVGRDRVAAAKALLAAHPEINVIISDDGLQHYALMRDVEIILFDQRGAGNGWLLPAGPLREPATRRRDFTVINTTSATLPDGLGENPVHMQLVADELFSLATPELRMTLTQMQGRRITAAAGIGNPQRYFSMLRTAGLRFHEFPLNDHYVFSEGSFRSVDADIILITEKDAVKCRQIANLQRDPRIWVVPVRAQLDVNFAVQLLNMISEKPHGRTIT